MVVTSEVLAPSGESCEGNHRPCESNGSLPPGGWLKVTCGLTACTPGSGPGPTLGNEYGRNYYLPFTSPTVVSLGPCNPAGMHYPQRMKFDTVDHRKQLNHARVSCT